MPKRQRGAPSYLRHSRSGRAITYVYDENGTRRQVVLGEYESPESRRRYHEILAQYFGGETLLAAVQHDPGRPLPEDHQPASGSNSNALPVVCLERAGTGHDAACP